MYQDAGYGDNWEPQANNARRFDPYTRSCTVLASLFAIGFVLIIIVVLSLIPIYISHKSTKTNNHIQTIRMFVTNYKLQLQSPYNNFDPQTVLSDSNNRQALEAALTSMLQKDSLTSGSIVEINISGTKSVSKKRRQTSNTYDILCNLNITNNKAYSSPVSLNQYHIRADYLLSNSNGTTSFVRYQQSNSTSIHFLIYRLPETIQSNVSFVFVDSNIVSSELSALLLIDNTQNQPSVENSTTTLG